ncbi:MAG: glucokinase [Okeania sp. SIO3C4]|nr:glucokinase [Okeania sp. SIO3C4]
MTILAGKIGGRSKLALFSHGFNGEKELIKKLIAESETFPTKKYEIEGENGEKILDTQRMIDDFLQKEYYRQEDRYGTGIEKNILVACFSVSGPVGGSKDNRTTTISRPDLDLKITFNELDFKDKLPFPGLRVSFLNYMVAIGKKIFLAEDEAESKVLYEGNKETDSQNDRVIMLVGDGLGQAYSYWDNKKKALLHKSSEGGHSLFAPRNESEGELWSYLLKERRQVISYEYVLSKSGLVRIYEFIKSTNRYGKESGELRERLTQDNTDPSPIIDQAINHSDDLADAALNMFIRIMGARAGDLALTYEAKGGIYVGGVPIPEEKYNIFKEAFLDKEHKFRQYNEAIPVYVYKYESSVLWGAASHAVDAGFVYDAKSAHRRRERQREQRAGIDPKINRGYS